MNTLAHYVTVTALREASREETSVVAMCGTAWTPSSLKTNPLCPDCNDIYNKTVLKEKEAYLGN